MLSQQEVLRLRSIGRYLSKAQNEIELANMLDVSPKIALLILNNARNLIEMVPFARPNKKPKVQTKNDPQHQ